MSKPKVHIYHSVDKTGASYRRMENAGIKVMQENRSWDSFANECLNEEIVFDADTVVGVGVATVTAQITSKSLESAPELRMIAKYTVGYDNVDLDTATKLGIVVVHSPTESNWGGVAEGTMAYILSLLKKVREKDRHVKNGGWRDPSLYGTYVGSRISDGQEGLTIGIIGLGRIGSRLADLWAPWRVKLLAYDPLVDEAKFIHHNVKSVDLETLLKEADVVTIHCDLNKGTTNLLSEEEFQLMKPNAILINAARGPIVDSDALFEALHEERISGAALDVLPEEPPDPQTPLLGLGDKILLSPHMITSNDGTGLLPAIPWVETAIYAVLKGKVPNYVVNQSALPKWRERFEGRSLL